MNEEDGLLVEGLQLRALHGLVDDLAADVGRLRRHPAIEGTSLDHLADRLATRLETIDCILCPSAAELAAMFWPEDSATVDAAIDAVDRRSRTLRSLLGEPTRESELPMRSRSFAAARACPKEPRAAVSTQTAEAICTAEPKP